MVKPHTDARLRPVLAAKAAPESLIICRRALARGGGRSRADPGSRAQPHPGAAIYLAALQDFPDRRIVIRKGGMIIADSRA
jgi:hypothetical protein